MSGKWKNIKKQPQKLVNQLMTMRKECKQQGLSTECSLITAMISAVRFEHAFRHGDYQRWSGNLGDLKTQLKNLQQALNKEFPIPDVLHEDLQA